MKTPTSISLYLLGLIATSRTIILNGVEMPLNTVIAENWYYEFRGKYYTIFYLIRKVLISPYTFARWAYNEIPFYCASSHDRYRIQEEFTNNNLK